MKIQVIWLSIRLHFYVCVLTCWGKQDSPFNCGRWLTVFNNTLVKTIHPLSMSHECTIGPLEHGYNSLLFKFWRLIAFFPCTESVNTSFTLVANCSSVFLEMKKKYTFAFEWAVWIKTQKCLKNSCGYGRLINGPELASISIQFFSFCFIIIFRV